MPLKTMCLFDSKMTTCPLDRQPELEQGDLAGVLVTCVISYFGRYRQLWPWSCSVHLVAAVRSELSNVSCDMSGEIEEGNS